MRLALVALGLCLLACGKSEPVAPGGGGGTPAPPSLTGSWTVAIAGTCSGGFMHIADSSGAITGTLGCGSGTDDVSGAFTPSDGQVSLTLKASGYSDATMVGSYANNRITGAMYNSGFSGQAFTATR